MVENFIITPLKLELEKEETSYIERFLQRLLFVFWKWELVCHYPAQFYSNVMSHPLCTVQSVQVWSVLALVALIQLQGTEYFSEQSLSQLGYIFRFH